nr:hypothetical protein [uncultured Alloprevotella sp.]
MRKSLWVLCDTSGVGERSGVLSTGSPFGHHPRLRMVCPRRGQWVSAHEVRHTPSHTAWKVCTLSVGIHLLCHHFSGEAEQGNSSPPAEAHHA